MRQTTLSVEGIIVQLQAQPPQYPKCLLVNELGELAATGDTKAEELLRGYLSDEDDHLRYPAYCHLSLCTGRTVETTVALALFALAARNARIVKVAHERLGITPQDAPPVMMDSSVARKPGFMEALVAFQYGETSEESSEGYRKMMEIASGPDKKAGN